MHIHNYIIRTFSHVYIYIYLSSLWYFKLSPLLLLLTKKIDWIQYLSAIVAMKSPSSKELLQIKCSPHTLLLFTLLTTFSTTSFSYEISYYDHCSSIIPQATPTIIEHKAYPLLRPGMSYYTAGERILGKNFKKYLSFSPTRNICQTNITKVYKFAASLSFRSLTLQYMLC